ncbi:hypothetical protein LSH36_32g03008 [Paralvinella palmiformis]|uniref:Metalloendopeptidase n=1 Tax=Paralvinella palmiformis TaxID=53620 RepID=A0AAD9NG46_9ANNE|nr:hypothetical protein LSH36_32g03008 [Paralvinella palmiformis]
MFRSLPALFCVFILKVNGSPIREDIVVPNIDELSGSEVNEYTVNENFGLDQDGYRNTRNKAKEYRILYATIHNKTIPKEPYVSSLLFGDIIYTEEQLIWFITHLRQSHHSRRKRNAINYDTYPNKKWTDKIPYTFSSAYSYAGYEKEYIRQCIKLWESETCVRFVEFDHNSTTYTDYVYIQRKIGCYSHYGRIGGRQLLGLGPTCFLADGYGYVIHEIGHVIGLFHEHSRYDRDDYVIIYDNNIRPGESHNFLKFSKRELRTFDQPYDYTSVMHYGSRSFSVDPYDKDTIRTLDPLYQLTIGQRYKQSFLDVKTVNLAYCPVCPNAGQVLVTRQPSCVRVGPYNDRTECTWLLKAPKDCQIEFWFKGEFEVLQGITSGPTCLHYVEVHYKGHYASPGPR